MQRRICRDDEAVSPVIAVILMVAITVVLAAVLYVWAASFLDQGESSPIAQFTVTKRSDGTYGVQVVKVSSKEKLEAFQFFLKDTNLNTDTTGEIANQNISSSVVGIESEDSWDVKYPAGDADLAARANDMEDEDNTCASNACPVVFYDNDRDDKLSSGDQFVIRGNEYGSGYDATSDWVFEIQFDLTGDIIGAKKLP